MSGNAAWRARVWADDEALTYSQSLEISGYVAAVSPVITAAFGQVGALLDVGAGDGRLAAALTPGHATITAFEPSGMMRQLLQARLGLTRQLNLYDGGWQDVAPDAQHDVALCANIGATQTDTLALFERLAPLCRKGMAWVVPAQTGPASFCLSGAFTDYLQETDDQPAYLRVLNRLGPDRQPTSVVVCDWVYATRYRDVEAAVTHLHGRILAAGGTVDVGDLRTRMIVQSQEDAVEGVHVSCPKRSAVLLWAR